MELLKISYFNHSKTIQFFSWAFASFSLKSKQNMELNIDTTFIYICIFYTSRLSQIDIFLARKEMP